MDSQLCMGDTDQQPLSDLGEEDSTTPDVDKDADPMPSVLENAGDQPVQDSVSKPCEGRVRSDRGGSSVRRGLRSCGTPGGETVTRSRSSSFGGQARRGGRSSSSPGRIAISTAGGRKSAHRETAQQKKSAK